MKLKSAYIKCYGTAPSVEINGKHIPETDKRKIPGPLSRQTIDMVHTHLEEEEIPMHQVPERLLAPRNTLAIITPE